jgi:transcriptional regulator with XRE-family HTH domain
MHETTRPPGVMPTRRHEFGDFAAKMRGSSEPSWKIRHVCWERLGSEVRDRRKELKLTQVEVAGRGGPSVATIGAIEGNRAGRLSRQSRRALERAIEWEPGSIDHVLAGGRPQPLGGGDGAVATSVAQDGVAAERFAVAARVLEIKRTVAEHREDMGDVALGALEEEVAQAAREVEEAIIKMLPWLSDEERGQAIRLLAELRQ